MHFTRQQLLFMGYLLVAILLVACSSTTTDAPISKHDGLSALTIQRVHTVTTPIGSLFYTYAGHTAMVFGVAWSPDAKRIASASLDGTVQVWEAE